MANKKYKLTDGNYWATDGIHDFGQNKTQREINAALVQADSDLSGAITSVEKGLAIIVTGDTCSTAVPSGGYAYIKNNTHGLTEGLYRNKSTSAFPTSGGTANSTVFEAVSTGGLNALGNNFYSNGTHSYTNASAVGYPQFFGFVVQINSDSQTRLECCYVLEKAIPYGKTVTVSEVYINARNVNGQYITNTNTDFHTKIVRCAPMGNILQLRFDFDSILPNAPNKTPFAGDGRLVFTIS